MAHFDPQRSQGTDLRRPIDEALGVHQHHLGDGLARSKAFKAFKGRGWTKDMLRTRGMKYSYRTNAHPQLCLLYINFWDFKIFSDVHWFLKELGESNVAGSYVNKPWSTKGIEGFEDFRDLIWFEQGILGIYCIYGCWSKFLYPGTATLRE
jgi:hypothetical protein